MCLSHSRNRGQTFESCFTAKNPNSKACILKLNVDNMNLNCLELLLHIKETSDSEGRGQKEAHCFWKCSCSKGSESRESVIYFLHPEVKRLEIFTFCFWLSVWLSVLLPWFMGSFSSHHLRTVSVPTQISTKYVVCTFRIWNFGSCWSILQPAKQREAAKSDLWEPSSIFG